MKNATPKILRTGASFVLKLATASLYPGLSAILIEGPERYSGEPLSALYLGDGRNREFLLNRFFARTEMVWQKNNIHPLAARAWNRRLQPGADLAVMDLELPAALLLPSHGCLRLLPWIKQKLALPPAEEMFREGLPRKLRRELSRCQRKYGYSHDLTELEDDFSSFYREMYGPYIRSRFATESVVVPENFFLAECRAGLLMRLLRHGIPVGGVVLQKIGGQLSSVWTGFSGAAREPGASGASDVLDLFTIEYARQQGCRFVDFGPSRPLLDDGVFRYKRKWGTRACLPGLPAGEIRLRPLRATAAVQSILANNFWITLEQGRLTGHLLVEGQTLSLAELRKIAGQAGQGVETIALKSLAGFSREISREAELLPAIRLLDLSRSRQLAGDLARL
jgi:hypothetical protein